MTKYEQEVLSIKGYFGRQEKCKTLADFIKSFYDQFKKEAVGNYDRQEKLEKDI